MRRGTTPSLDFTLPFDVDAIQTLYITFADNSGKVVLEKELADCTASEKTVTLKMSQADTLSLPAGVVNIQIRCKTLDNIAMASKAIPITVSRLLKDGEI